MKNTESHEAETVLRGLQPPPPPTDLRRRALAAARERMAAEPVPDAWWRIWNNRGLRVAWVAAVAMLLAGHVLVSPNPGGVFGPNPPAVADNQLDEQFLDILRPVRISADVHPTIGLAADAADLIRIENGGNPS